MYMRRNKDKIYTYICRIKINYIIDICAYICIYICRNIHLYVYLVGYIYRYIYRYKDIRINICIYRERYIHIYTYIYNIYVQTCIKYLYLFMNYYESEVVISVKGRYVIIDVLYLLRV